MARRLIRRYLPDFERVRKHKHLRFLGQWLHEPDLWHLNRNSVSKAFGIGLFMAFVPMPFQMIPAAVFSILWRANLPIAAALVWVTNPLTMPPVFFFCYRVGTWVLGTRPHPIEFEISWTWLSTEFLRVWEPFLLGCFLVATAASLIGYYGMHQLWRWHVLRDWEKRRVRQNAKPRARPRGRTI